MLCVSQCLSLLPCSAVCCALCAVCWPPNQCDAYMILACAAPVRVVACRCSLLPAAGLVSPYLCVLDIHSGLGPCSVDALEALADLAKQRPGDNFRRKKPAGDKPGAAHNMGLHT